jgi:Mn-containing catalase
MLTKPVHTVRVGEPDPKFGNMLLEQFGGVNGARRGHAIFGAGVEL